MTSKAHKVRQGESISSIAFKYGFFPEKIWNDPRNAQLKQNRKDPNILHEEDMVVVPEKQMREESGDTETKHRFRRKGVPEILRVQLFDEYDEPKRGIPYKITIDGNLRQGTTNQDGIVEERISPDARRGELVIGEDEETYILNIGYLDPITTTTGVRGRLFNLGYDVQLTNGVQDAELTEAIKGFQGECQLETTGKLNDVTLAELERIYGG